MPNAEVSKKGSILDLYSNRPHKNITDKSCLGFFYLKIENSGF